MDLILAVAAIIAVILLWNRVGRLERELDQLRSRFSQPAPAFQEAVAPAAPPPPMVFDVTPHPPPVLLPEPVAEPRHSDIESLIGSNWLNKVGVVVLLIGLALFIGFSLTTMGPLGRVMVGWATGAALLAAGVFAERKEGFRTFALALIGGGWAAIYFTTYAAHAVDAARIIGNRQAGIALLLAVASAMIAHSLRYRSQAATGVAFIAGFLTLAVSPHDSFSEIASVPLLAALLYLSWRYRWTHLAAAGAMFAYLAYALELTQGDTFSWFTVAGSPILWIYWTMLEAFDHWNARRDSEALPLLPFNASGFLLASVATWQRAFPAEWFLLLSSLAMFGSSVLRARPAEDGEGFEDRNFWGGFHLSLTLSASLACGFILFRLEQEPRMYSLMLLAQVVYLAGARFRSAYLRILGSLLFLPALFTVWDYWSPPFTWMGRAWQRSTPPLCALLVLFYIDRIALRGERYFSFAASFLLGVVLLSEAPAAYLPLAYTVAAGAAFSFWQFFGAEEFRWQAALLYLSGVASLIGVSAPPLPWISFGAPALLSCLSPFTLPFANLYFALFLSRVVAAPNDAAVFAAVALAQWIAGLRRNVWLMWASGYGAAMAAAAWSFDPSHHAVQRVMTIACLFTLQLLPRSEEDRVRKILRIAAGVAATVLLMSVLQSEVSGKMLTLAWSAEAAGLLAAGFLLRERTLRLTGLAVFLLCLGKLFFYDFSKLDMPSRTLSFIVLGLLMMGASWVYTRFREQISRFL